MLNVNYSSIKLEEKNYITFSAFIQKQLRTEYERNGENWMQFFFVLNFLEIYPPTSWAHVATWRNHF